MRSCVTISLVEEARGGPFVFWDGLADGCAQAAELGFDAVEVFAPGPDAVDATELQGLLDRHGLALAAVGTGGGWVKNRWHLCHPDQAIRDQAEAFIGSMIDMGAAFGAPAIIGSMQGRWGDGVERAVAEDWLAGALNRLGARAAERDVQLIYEPLNRYETNLVNTVDDGCRLLDRLETDRVRLLADLFHMNIEEVSIADAIRQGGSQIGHVHFVDSNRRPAGCGHMDYGPIAAALRDISYEGYASAEAFPYPDSRIAAEQTIAAYRAAFE